MDTKKELLKKAKEYLQDAEQFTAEQAPLVLQEFWRWELTVHITGVIITGLLIIIGATFPWKVYYSNWAWVDFDADEPTGLGALLFWSPIVVGVLSIVPFCYNLYNVAMIFVAPRIYLLEEIKNFF